MLVAGAVFQEWYWGPIFFAVFVGPFLLAAAAIAITAYIVVARRRGRRVQPAVAVGIGFLAVAVGTTGFFAYRELHDYRAFMRDARAAARQIDFPTYVGAPRLGGVRRTSFAALGTGRNVWVEARYLRGNRYAVVLEQRDPPFAAARGGCTAHPLPGRSRNFIDQPCRLAATPAGATVWLMDDLSFRGGRLAALARDGTLVVVYYRGVSDDQVLDWLDTLRPVPANALPFQRQR
ncbi:MAG: hypothetical protein LC640_13715 [Frankia sp.]|nr:hypothetical protein [Frankia sp.]